MISYSFSLFLVVLAYGTLACEPAAAAKAGAGPESGQEWHNEHRSTRPSAKISTTDWEAIRDAERALKAHGYNPGRIDGKLDSETKEALREFQKNHSLAITGELDHSTAERLGVEFDIKQLPSEHDASDSPRPMQVTPESAQSLDRL